MAGNSGLDAIKKAAAAKRNAGGTVANALKVAPKSSAGSAENASRNGAIARRLAKSSPVNDHDEDD